MRVLGGTQELPNDNIRIQSQAQGEINVEIAFDTKRDSQHMRSIALLTMVFLPGTFLAVGLSFFSLLSPARYLVCYTHSSISVLPTQPLARIGTRHPRQTGNKDQRVLCSAQKTAPGRPENCASHPCLRICTSMPEQSLADSAACATRACSACPSLTGRRERRYPATSGFILSSQSLRPL